MDASYTRKKIRSLAYTEGSLQQNFLAVLKEGRSNITPGKREAFCISIALGIHPF